MNARRSAALTRAALAILALGLPGRAGADDYVPGAPILIHTGVITTIPQIINGLIGTFLLWSTIVAATLFLLGAFAYTASGGEETWSTNGKKMMKAALIGYAIVLGSWLIISTVFFFIVG